MNLAGCSLSLDAASEEIASFSTKDTDGKWLEYLTVYLAPKLRDWDIELCWSWEDWPQRQEYFSNSTRKDVGIDCVAKTQDKDFIAIQCKARRLSHGKGNSITKNELSKFASSSSDPIFKGRWVITNGDVRLAGDVLATLSERQHPIKIFNLQADLLTQLGFERERVLAAPCRHCDTPDDPNATQSIQCMQDEAVKSAVDALEDHWKHDSHGIPEGEARGRIILPCGTGKTRISLRIVEELTPRGDVSVVLCPSIALVAQLRREYLYHAVKPIRTLCICSDQSAGYDPKREERNTRQLVEDPTLDGTHVSASEIKGLVTTDLEVIKSWLDHDNHRGRMNVVFSTYQSADRVAGALREQKLKARVLIADEAHRTAGIHRSAKIKGNEELQKRIRTFTLCHSSEAFPVEYRVYQTATPRVYKEQEFNTRRPKSDDWIVRSMDDVNVFGVELYRRSYLDAVRHGWLSDYRIIAVCENGQNTHELARELAKNEDAKGLTTPDFLRGLAFALALAGYVRDNDDEKPLVMRSCIAFMNTVNKSKQMAAHLQSQKVRAWLIEKIGDKSAVQFTLEHLDATSNVAARDQAKARLASASEKEPYGIINVGIFGEGVDSPSLSAVAFLEPRKSPIDVIQAVGRAMRVAPGKGMGYIVVPLAVPMNRNVEEYLAYSKPQDGWSELAQILLALRAHDERIEDKLSDLMQIVSPPQDAIDQHLTKTIVAIATPSSQTATTLVHEGKAGEAEIAAESLAEGSGELSKEKLFTLKEYEEKVSVFDRAQSARDIFGVSREPQYIVTAKRNIDGSIELRRNTVERHKPKSKEQIAGDVDFEKSRDTIKSMINGRDGKVIQSTKKLRNRRTRAEVIEAQVQSMFESAEEKANAISINVLERSGLTGNRIQRDANLLRHSIEEGSRYLRSDELMPILNQHLQLDHISKEKLKEQADGCTIAAILLMNGCMLHQRIANGSWLSRIRSLSDIKQSVGIVRQLEREWHQILQHDFKPILNPAVEIIQAIVDSGRERGLAQCLSYLTGEAERLAESYADMGSDHAGELFNKVMGNQKSDGAFFTRPIAASLAARLALDVVDDIDWKNLQQVQRLKVVDLACGSGTLLTAVLQDMKRRAKQLGATEQEVKHLQRTSVENSLKGLDINPVSLQLAAAQLTTGSQDIRYRKMGLHLMPYGPLPNRVTGTGTLELLGQSEIVGQDELGLHDVGKVESTSVTLGHSIDRVELEDPIDAVRNASIVIMNPPFTNRTDLGKKFPNETQTALRKRIDRMEQHLIARDDRLRGFSDKNSIGPLFVALAEKCLDIEQGVLATIRPTSSLVSPSGKVERAELANRFHIHTVITCHLPHEINLSQHTKINESLIIMKRYRQKGKNYSTRFINLDKIPKDEKEASEFHLSLEYCSSGNIPNGWGTVIEWPIERINSDDWTAAVWRSPIIAEAGARFALKDGLLPLNEIGAEPQATGRSLRGSFRPSERSSEPGSFPILKSKSQSAQRYIEAKPDEFWTAKEGDRELKATRILAKASHLLVTSGQRTDSGRLTAVASMRKYIGNGWTPVTNLTYEHARAIAVYMNSTIGRIMLMSNPGKTLSFPYYATEHIASLRVPDIRRQKICNTLMNCWESTKSHEVPQYREGECDVRRIWDHSVCEAMDWEKQEIDELRKLLHREPHVRGLGYNEYGVN